jgi:cytochrome c553
MLQRFRDGENWGAKDANSLVMNGVAANLTDDEITALASFIQGLYLVTE